MRKKKANSGPVKQYKNWRNPRTVGSKDQDSEVTIQGELTLMVPVRVFYDVQGIVNKAMTPNQIREALVAKFTGKKNEHFDLEDVETRVETISEWGVGDQDEFEGITEDLCHGLVESVDIHTLSVEETGIHHKRKKN